MSWPLYSWERDPVPTTQEAGWAPGLVWTGAENIAPHGFNPWTVEPIASSYQVCYPGPQVATGPHIRVICTSSCFDATAVNNKEQLLR